MATKRRLGVSLLLVGLAFVGAFHAALAVAFDTGLEEVSAALVLASLFLLVVVNVGAGD